MGEGGKGGRVVEHYAPSIISAARKVKQGKKGEEKFESSCSESRAKKNEGGS